MLRISASKLLSLSLRHGGRGFSSKKMQEPPKEWWNEPIGEVNPRMFEESTNLSKSIQLPAPGGQPPKTVLIADSASTSGMSYSNYDSTPCAEKKHSPCAEKAKQAQKAQEIEEKSCDETKDDFTQQKSFVPPTADLEKLESYEVKSTCTSFCIKADN